MNVRANRVEFEWWFHDDLNFINFFFSVDTCARLPRLRLSIKYFALVGVQKYALFKFRINLETVKADSLALIPFVNLKV